MVPNIDGPRACTKTELTEVIAIVDNEMRKNTEQTISTDYPHVYDRQNLKNIIIIKVGGELASVVPFVPQRIRAENSQFTIGIISPTVTSPGHRKKGYALQCLQKCLEEMDNQKISLSILWTLVPTFYFYEKADYQGVRNQTVCYKCSREDAKVFAAADDIEIAEYNSENKKFLDDIKAIYENSKSGVLRTRERLNQLLSLPKMQTYIALKNGQLLAYLVVSKAINKPGILEGGGEEKGLEMLLQKALLSLEAECEIKIYVSLENSDLGDLLARKIPQKAAEEEIGHMMVRLNDPREFFMSIAPSLVAQKKSDKLNFSFELLDTGEVISFNFSEKGLMLGNSKTPENFKLSRRELTSIIFGSHPERMVEMPAMIRDVLPFYFSLNILDHS